MRFIYTPEHEQHNPPYEIYDGVLEPYAEKKERLENIYEALREAGVVVFDSPEKFDDTDIVSGNLHHPQYFKFLQERAESLGNDEVLYPSYYMSDTYAPIVAGTFKAARDAVDVALTGVKYLKEGEEYVYSLCRPPGHHAGRVAMGGYCYFNNAALAANKLSQSGTVAVLDVDYHHGNGTQAFFYDRDDVFYVSLHADTHDNYPYATGYEEEVGIGKGVGYNLNIPMPADTTDKTYARKLEVALAAVSDFRPDYLVVSAGFDTFEQDPIGNLGLTKDYYGKMAHEIAQIEAPTLLIQEGGYKVEDLGDIACNFVRGFDPASLR